MFLVEPGRNFHDKKKTNFHVKTKKGFHVKHNTGYQVKTNYFLEYYTNNYYCYHTVSMITTYNFSAQIKVAKRIILSSSLLDP